MVYPVSDTNLPPEQWRPLFDAIGVEFGYRPLANRIGMDHTRLRRLLRGGGTSADAVQQVADAFRVSAATVRELRGEGRDAALEPFTLPDDAGKLNDNERNVIRAMVRALLDARDSSHVNQPATADPAATTRASDEARPPQEDGSAHDPEIDPLTGLGRAFGPDEIEDGDHGDEEAG